MPDFLIQGALCDLSIVLLVGLFDGVNRVFSRTDTIANYEELTRRGFIVRM